MLAVRERERSTVSNGPGIFLNFLPLYTERMTGVEKEGERRKFAENNDLRMKANGMLLFLVLCI